MPIYRYTRAMHTHQHVTNIKVDRDDKTWEVTVSAQITPEALAEYREHALKEIKKTAKMDGFRAGHVPEDRIIATYGEAAILRHAAEDAVRDELPEVFASQNLFIIEAPKVTMDAPEADKPLAFTARAALAPEVKLPDYSKIAASHNAKKEEATVSDEEHSKAMTHLRRERARIEKIEAGLDAEKAIEEAKALAETDLPELDDTFVQSLGYENAQAFSDALRTNIKTEKELQATEARRAAILEELVQKSTISYPAALREYELDDMEARIKDDITRAGLTFETYLEEIKKTREALRKEWHDAADKRAKVRLILAEIARLEKIEADEHKLAHELEHATKAYPQADKEALRAHISHAMRNDATLKWLETQEK